MGATHFGRRLAAAGVGAALGVACASGPECNVLRCYDGFEIHARSNALLAPGRYEIAVELDGVSGTCTIVFPRATEQSACDPELPVSVHWQSAGFVLGVITLAEVITVRVHRDAELLGEGTYEPEYRTVHTDRSLCSPTCEIAAPEVLRLAS